MAFFMKIKGGEAASDRNGNRTQFNTVDFWAGPISLTLRRLPNGKLEQFRLKSKFLQLSLQLLWR